MTKEFVTIVILTTQIYYQIGIQMKRGDKALKEIVKKIKKEGRGKDFDCLMGMSGGIDSSYLLICYG